MADRALCVDELTIPPRALSIGPGGTDAIADRIDAAAERAGALVGGRIRSRRLALGLQQAAVARDCGISPSYLALIEKGRRRIGGALLVRLAAALGVVPSRLAEGAPSALLAELHAVPGAAALAGEEPAEALAEAHPGWARLIAGQAARVRDLERRVADLGDRLAHDPRLAEALHEVISSAAAIRSSASILAEDGLDENWRRRFLRNVHEDAGRLAGGAGALNDWLEGQAPGGPAAPGVDPLAEASAWLAGLAPDALLHGGGADVPPGAAGSLVRGALALFARDAALLPRAALRAAVEEAGGDPVAAAARLDVPETMVLRRLAVIERGEGAGLILADASGVPTLTMVPPDFPLPRAGASCPLWPLHEVRSGGAAAAVCAVHGTDGRRWACTAAARVLRPAGLGAPPVLRAAMLVRPSGAAPATRGIGPGCALCPAERCIARREPFALAAAEPPAPPPARAAAPPAILPLARGGPGPARGF